ncbi:DUF2203 domain-containing protein [Candidatus Poribacteria bacterium]|nr:DUF2203 domain-containing protein [Candidatus Poribacteria bacterium]
MRQKKYFTVVEANRLIPTLERSISELKGFRQKLEGLGAELTPLFQVIHHNGGHPKSPQFIQLVQKFRNTVSDIHSYGCLLKDIEQGLVDFPHIRDDREVYLCWKSGEKEIRYWHEIDAGAAGRQLL